MAETYDQELVTPFKATSTISGEELMLSVGLEGEEYCEMGEVQVWVCDSGASTHLSPDADFLSGCCSLCRQ